MTLGNIQIYERWLHALLNKSPLSARLKLESSLIFLISTGRSFQSLGALYENDLSPVVLWTDVGTVRNMASEDLNVLVVSVCNLEQSFESDYFIP